MTYESKSAGQEGEDLATEYLKKHGYKIIERNLTTKLGEIDILARQKNAIVVVEVKTKSGAGFGEGFEMVNYFKQRKLLLLAKSLQPSYPKNVIRIDVISVNLATTPPTIRHFESAVEE